MPSTCQPVTFHRPRSLSQGTVMVCKGWSPTPLSPQPLNTWRLPFLPFQPPAKATSSIPSLLSSKGSVLCLLLLLRSALQIILSFLLSSSRHSTRVPVPHHGLQVQPRKRIVSFFPPVKTNPPALTSIPTPFSALSWCIAYSRRKTFTMREMSGTGWGDNTRASTHPDSCSCSTSHQ